MKNQRTKFRCVHPQKALLIVLSFNLLCLCLFPTGSTAETAVCIPYASGVPANPNPPIWWDDNDSGTFPDHPIENDRVDDPRWKGSAQISRSDMGDKTVAFRALYHTVSGQNFLYLSWHLKAPFLHGEIGLDDYLIVGFSPGSGSSNVIMKVYPKPESLPRKAVEPQSVYAYTRTDDQNSWASWPDETNSREPAWSKEFTRFWGEKTGDGGYSLAVHMRIPITTNENLDSGLNLGETFKMWYVFYVHNNVYGTYYGIPWPRIPWGESIYTNSNGTLYKYPPIDFWGDFCIGSCPDSSGMACASGVSLAALDIGTTNSPPHRINLKEPNTFFARPHNETGKPIPPGGLTARFRIANWGSLPDWNHVKDSESLWKDIIPGGATASNDEEIADGYKGTIETSPWTLDICDQYDFIADEPWPSECNAANDPARYKKTLHQCMLVELSGPELNFTNSSVYRNMDFATASIFSRDAEISVAGIGADALGRPERDVYLYVQTKNMPEFIEQDACSIAMGRAKAVCLEAAMEEPLTFELMAERFPTYIVHVFHDTGMRKKIGSVEYKKLRAQTSFGYFIQHEGELEGWLHSLSGDGMTMIAPNFYKIAIENDKSATVSTRIIAREPGRFRRCFDWFHGR